jgi:hypothetical protein
MPPQEQRRCPGLPGGGIEPARGLQVQRARLAQNRRHRAGVQGFLHDAQDFGILHAFDPNDAGWIEAQAGQARRIAIGPARGPEEKAIVLAQNFRRHRRRKGCHGRHQLAFQAACAKFVESAKCEPAPRQRLIQPRVRERQNARVRLQMMAFERADLQPQGFELRICIHDTVGSLFVLVLDQKLIAVNQLVP